MNTISVPRIFRSGRNLRTLIPGLDLSCEFIDNIRSIDKRIYPIFHPYEVLYEDFMNQYTGKIDDPRYCIGSPDGIEEEIWGWPLKTNKNIYKEDGHIHLWRLSDIGWSHIVRLESKDPAYLQTVVNRLYIQANYRDKYGDLAWNQKVREDEAEEKAKRAQKEEAQFSDIQKENKWLLRKAMDNFERGITQATNPTKEIITSFRGQTNHTKIIRPITDKEGGLI